MLRSCELAAPASRRRRCSARRRLLRARARRGHAVEAYYAQRVRLLALDESRTRTTPLRRAPTSSTPSCSTRRTRRAAAAAAARRAERPDGDGEWWCLRSRHAPTAAAAAVAAARATKRPRTTPTPMAAPRAHVFPGPQRGAKRAFTAAFFRLGMGKFKFVISETRSRVWFSSHFRRLHQTRLWWDFN